MSERQRLRTSRFLGEIETLLRSAAVELRDNDVEASVASAVRLWWTSRLRGRRRLQSAETERRRLVDQYQMQAIDLAEFQTRQHKVTSRHRQFEQERDALMAQRQELTVNNRLAAKVDSFARRIRTGIDAPTSNNVRNSCAFWSSRFASPGQACRFTCAQACSSTSRAPSPAAKPLEQWRRAGRWPNSYDQFWNGLMRQPGSKTFVQS